MKTFFHPKVHNVMVALRLGMSDAELAVAARAVEAGASKADVEKAVRAYHESTRDRLVVIPPAALSDEEKPGWCAAVETTAASTAPAVLATALPRLHARMKQGANRASQGLQNFRKNYAKAEALEQAETASREAAMVGTEAATDLSRRRTRWQKIKHGLTALAGVTTAIGAATHYGAFEPSAASLSWGTWLSVLLIGAGGALTETAIAWGIVAVARKYQFTDTQRSLRLALGGLAVGGLLYAGAITFLRTSAQSGSSVTLEGEQAGNGSISLLLGLISLATLGGLVLSQFKITTLAERLGVARQRETAFADTAARLARDKAAASKQLRSAETTTELPENLESIFEASVTAVRRKNAEAARILQEQIDRIRTAYDVLNNLSPLERQSVMTRIWTIVDVDDKPPESTTARLLPVAKNLAVLLLAAGLSGVLGCTGDRRPQSVVAVCDGTGTSAADVCSTPWLVARFDAWVQTAPPGSVLIVIPTAGNLETTRVASRFVVPAASRAQHAAWVRDTRAEVTHIHIPVDDVDATKNPNQSDIVSALVLASREARNLIGHGQDHDLSLDVGSDGWWIGSGFDLAAHVPRLGDVVKRLGPHGLPDLSAFEGHTSWCGLHSVGTDAKQLAARDEFWQGLLAAAHIHAYTTTTSCALVTGVVSP